MKEKTEIQQKIEEKQTPQEIPEEEFWSTIKLIAPGTTLRKALDGILRYGKGALIVLENDFLPPLLDGGFKVNCKLTSQKLIELSKMDGAIVISKNMKKILFANVLLAPDTKINTAETGTRHKAAERTAKQISGLTLSISEKKKEVTLFYKNRRRQLQSISEVIRRVNEYIQILEKQRDLFDLNINILNQLELKNYVKLNHSIKTIQKGKIIQEISKEAEHYLIELGNEGKLPKTRLKEILSGVEKETNLVIKDYSNIDYKKTVKILDRLSYEELIDKQRILQALNRQHLNEIVNVCGWRILDKTGLNELEIANLIKETKGFGRIISSGIDNKFTSLTENQSTLLKVELERLKLGI